MAKKNHTLGKLLALTTTVAAIGGTCYIFRDKIKQSTIYQKSMDKLSRLFRKNSDDFMDDDDFFFDDEDDTFSDDASFSDDSAKDREYTSIVMNTKQEDQDDQADQDDPTDQDDQDDPADQDDQENQDDQVDEKEDNISSSPLPAEEETDNEESVEEAEEILVEESIPTISFGGGFSTPVSTPEPPTTMVSEDSKDSEETVTGYEYEGLSDVSEDPDVLEEQDKLDF